MYRAEVREHDVTAIDAEFAEEVAKAVAEGTVSGYKKIKHGVVTGYKKIEDGVVSSNILKRPALYKNGAVLESGIISILEGFLLEIFDV